MRRRFESLRRVASVIRRRLGYRTTTFRLPHLRSLRSAAFQKYSVWFAQPAVTIDHVIPSTAPIPAPDVSFDARYSVPIPIHNESARVLCAIKRILRQMLRTYRENKCV